MAAGIAMSAVVGVGVAMSGGNAGLEILREALNLPDAAVLLPSLQVSALARTRLLNHSTQLANVVA